MFGAICYIHPKGRIDPEDGNSRFLKSQNTTASGATISM
jgi:hypothetical protein